MFPRPLPHEPLLLRQIAEGDEYAFATLYNHYRPNIYTTALRLTGQPWQAEEILQDVFLKVWMKRIELVAINNFGGWLYAVAENFTYNSIQTVKRKHALMTKYTEGSHEVVEIAEDSEYSSILSEAVEQLPDKQKQAYILIKREGLKREEAAKILNVSPETIKSNLDYAMKNIRAYCMARVKHLPPVIAAFWIS